MGGTVFESSELVSHFYGRARQLQVLRKFKGNRASRELSRSVLLVSKCMERRQNHELLK